MTVELQADSFGERVRSEIPRPNLTSPLRRRRPSPRMPRLTILYARCFSRIHVGERKATPTLIQVDCRGSTPFSAAKRISKVCAKIGRGNLIELLTNDLAVVFVALSWCRATGGCVERMESASGGYVLDLTPDGGETAPRAQLHAPPYDHRSHSHVPKGLGQVARASPDRGRGRRIEPQ